MAQEMRNSVPLWDRPVQGRAAEAWLTCGAATSSRLHLAFSWPLGGRNVMSRNDRATRKSGSSLSASLLETRSPFPVAPHVRG